MLRSATKGNFGLAPLAYEMNIAWHLMIQSYDVLFHDLMRGRGFDLLASSNGKSIEVECKHMSGDAGRKIHRKDLVRFGDRVQDLIRDQLPHLTSSIFVRLVIPDRLESNDDYQANLCALLRRSVLSGDLVSEWHGNRVHVEAFDLERVAAQWTGRRRSNPSHLYEQLLEHFNLEHKNALVFFRPKRCAIVLSIESNLSDDVPGGMYRELRKSTKNQFTGNHRGVLFCHLADLTNNELLSLWKESKDSALYFLGWKVLQRRASLYAVTFTAGGGLEGAEITGSGRAKSPAFVVANPTHPNAGEEWLSNFMTSWSNPQNILVGTST